jgi:hypothetical protein
MFPPGYNSKEATRRLASQFANPNLPGRSTVDHDPESDAEVQELKKSLYNSYPDWQKQGQIVTGSPKTLVKKLRHILEVLRPGIFSFWLDGPVPHQDRRTCVKLLGEEVVPALREIGKEMGLTSPFEIKPGTRPRPASGKYEPVGNAELLEASA